MQDTLINNSQQEKTGKKSKAIIAMLAVIGIIGCGCYLKPLQVEKEITLPKNTTTIPLYVQNMWGNWLDKFSVSYETEMEQEYRLNVFYGNVRKIKEFYAGPKRSFDVGLTQFADLTEEEFAALYLSPKSFQPNRERNEVSIEMEDVPESVDWRENGAVTDIKTQGQCGSCWAFSTQVSMEGLYYLQNKELLSFSEQQLIDCSHNGENKGCDGGYMDDAFTFYKTHSDELESDYQYEMKDQSCKEDQYKGHFKIGGYIDVPENSEEALMKAVAQQPVSVGIEADKSWFYLYRGGIFDHGPDCGTDLDHGVAAVGYGSENGTDYWIVKNSWGTTWGENGYIRLIRGVPYPSGQCGILLSASYPYV